VHPVKIATKAYLLLVPALLAFFPAAPTRAEVGDNPESISPDRAATGSGNWRRDDLSLRPTEAGQG